MATYTIRNDLIKPDYTDAADIDDLNDNFDFIDGSIAPCEWAKNTAPTANDDVTLGYIVGSLWFDTTNHKLYICEDNTDTAAVWRQLYPDTYTGDLKADGTVPLTANWDVGTYKITANQFESDVATGTAPFVVASTTLVSNLHAATADDAGTLDGKDSTAFAILAGQAGGQTLYGGTASGNGLTLHSTSDATKGYITIPYANLVLGTKATTAPNFALAIHEGAAGAANPVYFMDGDGSTVKSAIWKDASDNLALQAGTYSGSAQFYIGGTSGRCVFTNGLNGDLTFTDTDYTSNFSMTQRPQVANSISTTYYGVYDAVFPEVDASKTVTGSYKAYYTETMRNHNGASTDDDGTVGSLFGLQAIVGHYSSNASMAGTTTNVYACSLQNYGQKGTITNMYGLYIADSARGGTITNEWSIYDASSALAYFTGTVSAGTIVDRTPGYDGDGLAELKKVKNDSKGHLDHETLPPFARCKVKKEGGIEEEGRDLGAMISILTKAVQQLEEKLEAAYKKHDDAEKRIAALEARLAKHGI